MGIVAGILFIVAVVFFSGFFAARATGGYGWHRGYQNAQMGPGGPMGGGCPMMQMQGGMGPGAWAAWEQAGWAPGGMARADLGPRPRPRRADDAAACRTADNLAAALRAAGSPPCSPDSANSELARAPSLSVERAHLLMVRNVADPAAAPVARTARR